MLGLVLSDSTNPYFVELAATIEAVAAKRAHALMVGNSHGDRAAERQLISDLTRRQVDGIMVADLGPARLRGGPPPPVGADRLARCGGAGAGLLRAWARTVARARHWA